MAMIPAIREAGTGNPGTGYGRILELTAGLPSADLLALWDFDGGTVGQLIPGSVADKSGNGHDLILKAGYIAPRQTALGIDVESPNGAIFASGLNGQFRERTLFFAVSTNFPGSESGIISNFWGAEQASHNDGDPASNNATNTVFPVLNTVGATATSNFALYASTSAIAWGTGDRRVFAGSPGRGQNGILAVSIDGPANQIRLKAYGQVMTTIDSAAIGAFFDGVTARPNLSYGIWPNGSARSAGALLGRLYNETVYDRAMTEAEMADIMARIHAKLTVRGVTFP